MKKITDEWKPFHITFHYFGNTNNNFGLKKKKVLLVEDKIHSLSEIRKTSEDKLKKTKNNKICIDYMLNNASTIYNKDNNFESIKIKDFEKAKNYYFFNYFQNAKYFNRINSYKRILSSDLMNNINNKINNLSHNDEKINLSERKKEIKNINQVPIKLVLNRKKREFKLSKIDINKIISDYIQENQNDIELFNQKNRKINNKMKTYNRLKFNHQLINKYYKKYSNSTINKTKKNIDITFNKSNDDNINKNNNNESNIKRYNNNISYNKRKNNTINYNNNRSSNNNTINNRNNDKYNNINNKKDNNIKNNNGSSLYKNSRCLSFRESNNEINSNLKYQKMLFNLKYSIENKTKIGDAITISKKNFFYNKAIPKQKNERSKILFKKVNLSDASTITDFYKKK